MRSITKTLFFLVPVALIGTFLLSSPKKVGIPSDLRDAPANALPALQDAAGPQTTPAAVQPAQPAPADETVAVTEEDEAKGRCHDHHNNLPGCPGFCARHQEHPACALPFHCRNNMTLYACKKHCQQYPNSIGCGNKSVEDKDASAYDEGLAKANCAANPNAPGCPLFCKDHHAYPGCPMFCQLNPLNPACKKFVAEDNAEEAVTPADEEEAKGRCHDHHNNLPGCPGFCARHQEHAACALPFHCRNNMTLYACKKHCQQYPNSIGCGNKSVEEAGAAFDEDLARANCAGNPNAPGCPLFCKDHHAYPGCPMFCQLNPLNPACKK